MYCHTNIIRCDSTLIAKQHLYADQGQEQAEHPSYRPWWQTMDGSSTKGCGQRAEQCNSSQCRQVHITQRCVRQTLSLAQ